MAAELPSALTPTISAWLFEVSLEIDDSHLGKVIRAKNAGMDQEKTAVRNVVGKPLQNSELWRNS